MARSIAVATVLLVLSGDAKAQSTSPADPDAARRTDFITWLGAGAVLKGGTSAFGTTFGFAGRLRGQLGFSVDWADSWFTDDWVTMLRPGLTWYFTDAPLAPFVGAHYTLFRLAGDRWENGMGARLGLFAWRQAQATRRHRFGLSAFVTYDHAFACSGGCDVWAPQAALTWEPHF